MSWRRMIQRKIERLIGESVKVRSVVQQLCPHEHELFVSKDKNDNYYFSCQLCGRFKSFMNTELSSKQRTIVLATGYNLTDYHLADKEKPEEK